jgi:hypothetical protein
MDFDTQVKLAIYRHIAETTGMPTVGAVAAAVSASEEEVREAYQHLSTNRALVFEPDGVSIRMAMPFSGIATQHRVRVDGREYFANCAWDALGVIAALQRPGAVLSRCEQTLEPIELEVGEDGPAPEPCVIHFAVPAAHWWKDIVFT